MGHVDKRLLELLDTVKGGDRRSVGRVNQVVEAVLREPELLPTLVDGMVHDDPVVRMRAADALEKATRGHPEWLARFKHRLLDEIAAVPQPEVRWHVAQMLPRVPLDTREEARAVRIVLRYLDDESRIVKTCSMQALAEFASRNRRLQPRVVRILEMATRTGSPAMRSRGRRLLTELRRERVTTSTQA